MFFNFNLFLHVKIQLSTWLQSVQIVRVFPLILHHLTSSCLRVSVTPKDLNHKWNTVVWNYAVLFPPRRYSAYEAQESPCRSFPFGGACFAAVLVHLMNDWLANGNAH